MLKEILDKLQLIIFDFDGVFTDNKVYVDQMGREMVQCDRRDGLGISMLKNLNIKMLILSTEGNPVVEMRAKKLGLPVVQNCADKKAALTQYCRQENIDIKQVAYLGNDVNDLQAMQMVGYAICPSDAHPAVKSISQLCLKARGGDAVIRELCELLLSPIDSNEAKKNFTLFEFLKGQRVNLKKVHMDGLHEMHAYSVRHEFFQHMEYDPFVSINETRDYLKKLIEKTHNQLGYYWFVLDKETHHIMGTIGLSEINWSRKSAEIGYGISPLYWNKGYFSDALKTVLKHLFIDNEFKRVFAITSVDNIASKKALLKQRFSEEGILRNYYYFKEVGFKNASLLSLLQHEFMTE